MLDDSCGDNSAIGECTFSGVGEITTGPIFSLIAIKVKLIRFLQSNPS